MSQSLPFPTRPGTPLVVRGQRFRLAAARPWTDCVELHLVSPAGGKPLHLLWPFDRPRARHLSRPRMVGRARARAIAARALASAVACDGLFAAATARVDLLPFQLEPALAVVSGLAHRVLLADAVGLGKTIQAGLVIAELGARQALSRALVVTPPGLREQWIDELATRFGIAATLVDLAWLRRMRAEVGPGANPWVVPRVAVASYDFVKRPEVLRGLEPLVWDALVLDEAHAASPGTGRATALDRLAQRARQVLLLTATPHAGDEAAFRTLCAVGAVADEPPLAMFRRTRRDVGLPSDRRTHLLAVRPTPPERRVYASLARYARHVWAEAAGGPGARLAMEVLTRRACSSPASLLRSLERRIRLLQHDVTALEVQLALPLDPEDEEPADGEPLDALATPGLADGGREIAWLAALVEEARAATAHPSKLRRLVRLLRAVREPAIVFTEYRDTLHEIAPHLGELAPVACLHGALGRAERRDIVRRFTAGEARLLLATDAAGEGLNLHERCRLVINLELPWSPRRLEQRAGRVDRLGQSRRVHIVDLVGRGTADERVLGVLRRRTAAARRALGDGDDLGDLTDAAIAARVIAGAALVPAGPLREPSVEPRHVDLGARAREEVGRLLLARRAGDAGAAATSRVAVHARGRRTRSVLLLARVSWTDGTDVEIERAVIAVRAQLRLTTRPHTRAWKPMVHALEAAVRIAAAERVEARRPAVVSWLAARCAAALARERGMAAAIEADAGRLVSWPVQRGLFDRRGERQVGARHEALHRVRTAIQAGIARHVASGACVHPDVTLTLACEVADADGD